MNPDQAGPFWVQIVCKCYQQTRKVAINARHIGYLPIFFFSFQDYHQISVNSLDPDQGSRCSQRLSADNKVANEIAH